MSQDYHQSYLGQLRRVIGQRKIFAMFSMVFWVQAWSGQLTTKTDETTNAQFFPLASLPEIPPLYEETIADWHAYRRHGLFILK